MQRGIRRRRFKMNTMHARWLSSGRGRRGSNRGGRRSRLHERLRALASKERTQVPLRHRPSKQRRGADPVNPWRQLGLATPRAPQYGNTGHSGRRPLHEKEQCTQI
eukprot:gene24635-biopygen14961